MKDMGISRKIDELGRVVLPIETRRALGIDQGDAVSFFLDSDGQSITLRKCEPSCCSCQSQEKLKVLPGGKYICEDCLKQVM